MCREDEDVPDLMSILQFAYDAHDIELLQPTILDSMLDFENYER